MDKDEEFVESFFKFLTAQDNAEKEGKHEFTCPVCGGIAWWNRATTVNNHLHCGCKGCGIHMME